MTPRYLALAATLGLLASSASAFAGQDQREVSENVASRDGVGEQQRKPPPAQPAKPAPKPIASPQPKVMIRGLFNVGFLAFNAADSFNAILGSSTGFAWGGGVDVIIKQRWFAQVDAERFKKTGDRAFVFDNQVFNLGIPDTITITPLRITGGYRFGRVGRSLQPYAGGGIGFYGFKEESAFANDEENVDDSFTGFHVVGGAEFRVLKWLGVGGEALYATVPDALGESGVASALGDSNLGGFTARVRVVIGR